MPLRPFPFELGIGIDTVHIPRIRAIIFQSCGPERYHHPSKRLRGFMRRFLTYREQSDFWVRFQHDEIAAAGSKSVETARYLAGRWAAKEATIKALGARKLSFMDIQILRRNNSTVPNDDGAGAVYAVILDQPGSPHPPASKSVEAGSSAGDVQSSFGETASDSADVSGHIAKISISHDGDYATAVCLAAQEPVEGDVGGEAAARSP